MVQWIHIHERIHSLSICRDWFPISMAIYNGRRGLSFRAVYIVKISIPTPRSGRLHEEGGAERTEGDPPPPFHMLTPLVPFLLSICLILTEHTERSATMEVACYGDAADDDGKFSPRSFKSPD